MVWKIIYLLSLIISTAGASINIRAIIDQFKTYGTFPMGKDDFLTPIYIFLIIFNSLLLLK